VLLLLGHFSMVQVDAQFSRTYQTRQGIETGYVNILLEGDNGYFLLKNTANSIVGSTSRDIVVTKFDFCHEEIWSKAYHSSGHLNLKDAVLHDSGIAILMQKALFFINPQGEVLWAESFQGEKDIAFNRVVSNGTTLDIIGATDLLRQNLTIKLEETGQIIETVQIRVLEEDAIEGAGPSMGGRFNDGSVIQREGNALIKLDKNYNIQWAKQFNLDFTGVTESEPLVFEDDIIYSLRKDGLIFLVRMNHSGDVVWQSEGFAAQYSSNQLFVVDKIIYILATFIDATSFGLVEIDGTNGDIVDFRSIHQPHLDNLSFPQLLVLQESNDILVTASCLISFAEKEWEDILFIEPQYSHCHTIKHLETAPVGSIFSEDVIQYLEAFTPEIEQLSSTIITTDLEYSYYEVCNNEKVSTLDSTFHCDEPFIFEGLHELTYEWSDGDTSRQRIFDKPTSISVSASGCKVQQTISLNITEEDCPCQLYLPNIFKPTSSNIENSTFGAFSNCSFNAYYIKIFDRWGNLVFHTLDPSQRWVGDFQGGDAPQGVYVYLLRYRLPQDKETKELFGSVTLLR